ncbi:MAG: GNAT family N-acetyltransferase [Actinomycetota bacterium]|nr:GNAT family N-acetyltransferase [Actinomycetota bacterium]
MTDGVVTLRPWRPEDVDPLVALCDDPEIVRFTRVLTPYTRDDALMYLAQQVAAEERGEAVALALVDAADDRLVGSVDLRRASDGRASLGYLVGAAARGRGVATRAARMLSRWALAEWGVARVEIHVQLDNPASQRVAERAGFVREGVLRSYLEVKGRRHDSVVFSLVPDDVGSAP